MTKCIVGIKPQIAVPRTQYGLAEYWIYRQDDDCFSTVQFYSFVYYVVPPLIKKHHSILWYKTVVYYGIIPWYFGTGKLW